MTLWVSGRVEVIEAYDDRRVQSPAKAFDMPSIVRYIRGRRPYRQMRVKFSKPTVYARDKGHCQYCGANLRLSEATFDHVVPRSRGGATSWENVVIACRPCNQRKGNKTPKEARMRLATTPKRPASPPKPVNEPGWRFGMPEGWRIYLRA
jgi:5-methylcytosine-specific restriction endonuclease McrA